MDVYMLRRHDMAHTLTESDSVKPVSEFGDIVQLRVHGFELIPQIAKLMKQNINYRNGTIGARARAYKSSSLVLIKVFVNVNAMHEHSGVSTLAEPSELEHSRGMSRIAHAMPENLCVSTY